MISFLSHYFQFVVVEHYLEWELILVLIDREKFASLEPSMNMKKGALLTRWSSGEVCVLLPCWSIELRRPRFQRQVCLTYAFL